MFLRAEPGPTLADLPGVLSTYAEDVGVRKAHSHGRRGVERGHYKGCEKRLGSPGRWAPFDDVPMVAWFAPAEETGQEDEPGVEPDENDAGSKTAGRDDGRVGEWPRDGYITVHADTRQRGHGDALQDAHHIAEDLAGKFLV